MIRGAKTNDLDFDGNTSLDKLNTEVANWAFKTKEEISKLQSLSKYRKEYVGNISHELKTPIFSIQGYLHTLLEGGIHDENINVSYLQKALYNLDRLENIVEDLDTINHLESNKDAIIIAPFDIRELIKKVLGELEKVASDASIILNYDVGDSSPIMVMGDQKRIHQVIYNLLINSIKYGKEGGTTKVNFHPIEKQIVVEVVDDGIGIEERHLNHLFDRFYRVDQSRSRSLGGSGLGLSIVKHILETHDQSISVSSVPGAGSTFSFALNRS